MAGKVISFPYDLYSNAWEGSCFSLSFMLSGMGGFNFILSFMCRRIGRLSVLHIRYTRMSEKVSTFPYHFYPDPTELSGSNNHDTCTFSQTFLLSSLPFLQYIRICITLA